MSNESQLTLPTSVRPTLQKAVQVERSGETIRVLARAHAFEAGGESAAILADMIGAMDGQKSISELAEAMGLEVDSATQFVQTLYCKGLVVDRARTTVPAKLFYHHARGIARAWMPDGKCIRAILEGPPNKRLVIGFLLEEWHFIRINQDHLGAAVIHAGCDESQLLWSRFLAEEYEHGNWLAESVRQILTPDEMARSMPLPTTEAFSNLMRWLSRKTELGYALALAMLETDEAELTEANLPVPRYQKIAELGLLPKEVFEMYIRHGQTDQEAEHVGLTETPFDRHPPLTREQQEQLLRYVWTITRAVGAYEEGILNYYTDPTTPRIPLIEWD